MIGSESSAGNPRVAVLGVGNTLFGDDGIGYCIVTALISCGARGPTLLALERLSPGDLAILDGLDYIVIIDSSPAEESGGRLRVVQFNAALLDSATAAFSLGSLDPHGVRPLDLVVLARSAGVFKGRGALIAVPAYRLEFGCGLSPKIITHVGRVLDVIRDLTGKAGVKLVFNRDCVIDWIKRECRKPQL